MKVIQLFPIRKDLDEWRRWLEQEARIERRAEAVVALVIVAWSAFCCWLAVRP